MNTEPRSTWAAFQLPTLGLVYLGFQRSFASNTLSGVSQDALAVIAPLVAWIRDAPAAIGLSAPVPTTLQTSNCVPQPR